MNTDELIAALDLPAASRVDQRVPKKLLLENGAPTAADKRHINEGIEELFWLAALKPTTIGVPEYKDSSREYLEIDVVRLTLRTGAKVARLVELVHRAIPYPVLLLTEQSGKADLSAAHIRWAHNEAGKTVLEGDVIAAGYNAECDVAHWPAFRTSLALSRQPQTTIYALYQGWIDALVSLQVARLSGALQLPANPEQAATRYVAMQDCDQIQTEIYRLRAQAARETQLGRRVELNLRLKALLGQLADRRRKL